MIRKNFYIAFFFAIASLNLTPLATAQESLTLSVSPTLFDMSAEKGQSWQSSIKVINVNDYELTVYASVVDFIPRGESGEVSFVPINKEDELNNTLAEWINITNEPIVVPSEQTVEIPFSITVPKDASPGGHYSAVLIGTKPIQDNKKETKVQTSQMVTSLIFTRIAGDINESGDIREFRTTKSFLSRPEATFELRFENRGNVYLQPQGEIKIFNMWGEERGIIPINQNSHYGKVPQKTAGSDGIRKFTFDWKGEWSMADIGRYRAEVTLAYGADDRQFANSETTFWVVPFKLLFSVLLGIIVFIFLVSWLIKLYVRRMLKLAGVDVDNYSLDADKVANSITKRSRIRGVKIHTPVKVGILDLKQGLRTSSNLLEYTKTFWSFTVKNRLFFLGILLIVIFVTLVVWYISNANTSHRAFEVTYVNNDSRVSVSSEEIIYNQMKSSNNESTSVAVATTSAKINIINRSGLPGVGAKAKLVLEAKGYQVSELQADFSSPQTKTVVVYSEDYQTLALDISAELNNALISLNDTKSEKENTITIFLGADMDI